MRELTFAKRLDKYLLSDKHAQRVHDAGRFWQGTLLAAAAPRSIAGATRERPLSWFAKLCACLPWSGAQQAPDTFAERCLPRLPCRPRLMVRSPHDENLGEREIFIDNLLVRVHLIIEMSRPALRHGGLDSLFQVALYLRILPWE